MTIDGLEIKPCPYCGNTDPILRDLTESEQIIVSKEYSGAHKFIISCGRYNCDCKYAFIGSTKKSCIEHWNEEAEKVLKKYGEEKKNELR